LPPVAAGLLSQASGICWDGDSDNARPPLLPANSGSQGERSRGRTERVPGLNGDATSPTPSPRLLWLLVRSALPLPVLRRSRNPAAATSGGGDISRQLAAPLPGVLPSSPSAAGASVGQTSSTRSCARCGSGGARSMAACGLIGAVAPQLARGATAGCVSVGTHPARSDPVAPLPASPANCDAARKAVPAAHPSGIQGGGERPSSALSPPRVRSASRSGARRRGVGRQGTMGSAGRAVTAADAAAAAAAAPSAPGLSPTLLRSALSVASAGHANLSVTPPGHARGAALPGGLQAVWQVRPAASGGGRQGRFSRRGASRHMLKGLGPVLAQPAAVHVCDWSLRGLRGGHHAHWAPSRSCCLCPLRGVCRARRTASTSCCRACAWCSPAKLSMRSVLWPLWWRRGLRRFHSSSCGLLSRCCSSLCMLGHVSASATRSPATRLGPRSGRGHASAPSATSAALRRLFARATAHPGSRLGACGAGAITGAQSKVLGSLPAC
jgi:hypothetical protein